MRDLSKDFCLCAYNLTKSKTKLDVDCNRQEPKYKV